MQKTPKGGKKKQVPVTIGNKSNRAMRKKLAAIVRRGHAKA